MTADQINAAAEAMAKAFAPPGTPDRELASLRERFVQMLVAGEIEEATARMGDAIMDKWAAEKRDA